MLYRRNTFYSGCTKQFWNSPCYRRAATNNNRRGKATFLRKSFVHCTYRAMRKHRLTNRGVSRFTNRYKLPPYFRHCDWYHHIQSKQWSALHWSKPCPKLTTQSPQTMISASVDGIKIDVLNNLQLTYNLDVIAVETLLVDE